ncbi:hypothetical protein JS528_04470 [Bifidobacterium sp. MA2]|uniref:Alpha-L-arabinofuranosidase C-terminal domain-containing protein n=1 Tax=Bifidobacterium santillanense TaxID=2809028 RepID=A0ABS5UP27_9BIFI|nr:hypothetical protein [Bifidobacterium santillanense]MBT1172622.1 hypothetical protein [Bifidobacterium santillanense]
MRVVNATDEPHAVALDVDEPVDGRAEAEITMLAAPWDAGRPFEAAPAEPTVRRVPAAALARIDVTAYSLSVVTLPDDAR